ncbi:OmpA family protein [Thiolapillus brandeum]|uniref:OmpA family protein n=1 Tax=Thiolapillus brandeum TaxID=1076588 RepID=A0A7U6GJ78_9GAMM|nr:OmpA family protein [Thiolapillus brandeum]BAO44597.1 OmpA family protein [Thiolapillus brandeum]
MKKLLGIPMLAGMVALAGCTDPSDPNRKTKTGAMVGAVAGAVIGHQVNHKNGAYVGAALGALAGGGVGYYMDKQQRELEEQLAREQAAHELEIQRMKDDSLKLTLNNEVSFDFDSAEIKHGFQQTLDKLASVIQKYDKTVVHVVGHTDSVGSAAYNQQLSERRARAVGRYLSAHGVAAGRIHTEGRGESEPRATNATEAGRQLNRRVEIFLKPVVEGEESRAHEAPPSSAGRYY